MVENKIFNDVVANPSIAIELQKSESIVTSVWDSNFNKTVINIAVTIANGPLAGRNYRIKVPVNTAVKVGDLVHIRIDKATPYARTNNSGSDFVPIRLSLTGQVIQKEAK